MIVCVIFYQAALVQSAIECTTTLICSILHKNAIVQHTSISAAATTVCFSLRQIDN